MSSFLVVGYPALSIQSSLLDLLCLSLLFLLYFPTGSNQELILGRRRTTRMAFSLGQFGRASNLVNQGNPRPAGRQSRRVLGGWTWGNHRNTLRKGCEGTYWSETTGIYDSVKGVYSRRGPEHQRVGNQIHRLPFFVPEEDYRQVLYFGKSGSCLYALDKSRVFPTHAMLAHSPNCKANAMT